MPKLTTDLIIGVGLVIALLVSLFIDGSKDLQTNIACGLIGFMGKFRTSSERDEVPHAPTERK